MKEVEFWKGTIKIVGIEDENNLILRIDSTGIDLERLENLIKNMKEGWRATTVLSLIGELERFKLDLILMLNEMEREEGGKP